MGFPGWRSSRRPSWQSTHSPLSLCLLGKGIPERLVCGRHGAKCFPCFLYDLSPPPPPASSGVLCHRVHCPDKETMAGGVGHFTFRRLTLVPMTSSPRKGGLKPYMIHLALPICLYVELLCNFPMEVLIFFYIFLFLKFLVGECG